MRLKTQQQGMTGIGWLIVLAMAGLLLLFMLRLFIVFYDDFTISSALHSLENDDSLKAIDTPEGMSEAIKSRLIKRFAVNNASDIVDPSDITIEATENGYKVSIVYDAQAHLIGNIDAVAHFNHSVMVNNK